MKTVQIAVAATVTGILCSVSADALAQGCTTCGSSNVCVEGFADYNGGSGESGVGGFVGTNVACNSGGTLPSTPISGVLGLLATAGQGSNQNQGGVVGITYYGAGGSGVIGLDTSSCTLPSILSTATGAGVLGISSNGNGVEGHTTVTDSAIYGQNDSGGTGGNGVAGRIGAFGSGGGVGSAIYGDNNNSNGSAWAGFFNGSVRITGSLTLNGSCNGTGCSSDIRLKKNVEPLRDALGTLLRLKGVSFEWKEPERQRGDHNAGMQRGFIAQEVERVFPQWVGQDPDGFKTLTISPAEFDSLVVEGVRTLQTENAELRARAKVLEAQRRPLLSGFGESGMIGAGLLGIAAAWAYSVRRKRSDARS